MGAEGFREVSLLMAQMRRVTATAINKRLAPIGTSMQAYKVLYRLVNQHEVPQHELAWDAAMDPAAVSRLIQGMVKQGLVSTRVDPTDKRQRFARVTPKGRALERTLSPIIDAALEPFQQVLSPDEEAQFVALMRKACEGVIARAQEASSLPPQKAAPGPARKTRASKLTRPRAQRSVSG